VPFGLGRFRPDLIDVNEKQLYEIKTVNQAVVGEAKLRFYLTVFNWADPTSRLKKWTAGDKFVPSRYIKLRSYGFGGAWAIVSPPILGVIVYKVVDFDAIILQLATIAILYGASQGAALTGRFGLATLTAPGVG